MMWSHMFVGLLGCWGQCVASHTNMPAYTVEVDGRLADVSGHCRSDSNAIYVASIILNILFPQNTDHFLEI